MAQYRDELEAARHRVETLQAQLEERDAALRAREAELAEARAEAERARKGRALAEPARPRPWALLLGAVGVSAALGYAFLRESAEGARHRAEIELARVELASAKQDREVALAERERLAAELSAARAAARYLPPPSAPSAPAIPYEPSGKATLNLSSIPASNVALDGRPLGSTPRVGVAVTAGTHEVTFTHPERGKRSVLVSIEDGETKTAAVKFE